MFSVSSKKLQFLNKFIKFSVLILAFVFIAYKFSDVRVRDFFSLQIRPIFILLVLFFAVINWLLETKKWQILITPLENLRWQKALKAVLIGVSLGIFTPNRIGEIGGRALVLNSQNRSKAALLTSIGSLLQLSITIIFGLISLYFLIKEFSDLVIKKFLPLSIYFVIILLIFILLAFFIFRKKQFYIPLSKLGTNRIFIAFILSLIRYIVFLLQFYLILKFLAVEISFIESSLAISAVFLVINLIPNFVISDLGIRSGLIVLFLGHFSTNTIAIGIAPLLLWVINLFLPSLFGYWLFLRENTLVFV